MTSYENALIATSISGRSRISHWGGAEPLGGHQPPTWVLFGKNVCENKRIGSCWGGMCQQRPPRSANEYEVIVMQKKYFEKLVTLT